MSRKIFRELVSVEEAKDLLKQHFKPNPIGVEEVPLERLKGRVLAENIEAAIDIPPFDRATMDGFAVQAQDTFGAEEDSPIDLKLMGRISAGQKPKLNLKSGQTAEVSTGAPIPNGANAVVMVEYSLHKGEHVKIRKAATPGENVMAAGSDIMAGELILRKRSIITPREIGVLAALGLAKVRCFIKPKVAVLSTGDEVVTPGRTLPYGKVYDINTYSICDSVSEAGCEPVFMGIVKDSLSDFTKKLNESIKSYDVLITSGSTSAGRGDLLYRVVNSLGKPGILVHGISIKPGKPTILGVIGNKPIFGLPGYPTSALTIFDIFVRPVLREMAGLKLETERKTIRAHVSDKIVISGGRREYLPVNIVQNELGGYAAYPVFGGSGAITTLSKADGFIEIAENKLFLEKGEEVQVKLFSPEIKPADLMIIGSHCIGLDILLELMLEEKPDLNPKIINAGSSGGLAALSREEADIAGTHILDEKTGRYNISFLNKYELRNGILVRGYVRRQGLILRKKNMAIKSIEDLLKGDLSFVNRNPGSGTRILFDLLLRRLAEKRGTNFLHLSTKIKGYQTEAKSHTAVAAAILQGKADVGIGIETAAIKYGLDFIHIADENYDFAINKSRFKKQSVQLFIKMLKSKKFKNQLTKRAPGLAITDETGTKI
ncbi:MAG: molybdopterin biosynthesis protein [Candidatus Bathyarchaeota archaeon]